MAKNGDTHQPDGYVHPWGMSVWVFEFIN